MATTKRTLMDVARDLIDNSEAVAARKVDWPIFSARNHALWNEVARGEMNIIGTPCSRRHARVHRYLDQIRKEG